MRGANAHLSDDKTVAKMGHPDIDVGHPPTMRLSRMGPHLYVFETEKLSKSVMEIEE